MNSLMLMDISLYGHFLFCLYTIMIAVLDAIYTALKHLKLHTYSYDITNTQSSLTDHDSYSGLSKDTICIAFDVMTHLSFLLVAIVRLHSFAPNIYKHEHGLCTVLRQYIRTMDSTTTLQSSFIRLKSKSHAPLYLCITC